MVDSDILERGLMDARVSEIPWRELAVPAWWVPDSGFLSPCRDDRTAGQPNLYKSGRRLDGQQEGATKEDGTRRAVRNVLLYQG